MGRLRAGVGHADITPPVGTLLEGYIERRGVAQGVHDKLSAKAVVLEDGIGKKIAVISCDLIGVGRWAVDFARKGIESRTGIKGSHVMITATHTHSGPRGVVDFFTGEGIFSKGLFDRNLSERIGKKIVEVTVNADSNLKEARIGLARGNVIGLCSNRRTTNDPFDPELGVVRIDSTNGNDLIGCIANYACHPTVLGPNNLLFSADFPAYVYDTVKKTVNTRTRGSEMEVLFLNGAAGNVSTRFTRKESTFAEAERIGGAMGLGVLKAIQAVKNMSSDMTIGTSSEIVRLPQRKLPPLDFVKSDLKRGEELLGKLKTGGASEGQIRVIESMTEGAKGLLTAYDYASKFEGREFEVEIQIFRFGDVVTFCAVPAELFVEIGLQIKKNLKQFNPLVVGYANGFVGYVLTEEAYREGGYEALSTFLEPNAGTIIIEAIKKLSRSLYTN